MTEDSFSDGGRYLAPADAVAHALQLRADGADIIELGPAASHPDSRPVDAAEQRRRLSPVLDRLAADGIPVSVDALHPQVQRFAIAHGAAYLNVLVSPSRKSFLRTITGKDTPHAGAATLAAEIFAARQGADYIRTHDVAAIRDALAVLGALAGHAERP